MMFLQGQRCFFCNNAISKSEASVEHLIPSSAGGSDHTDNLVACCRTLNALFGNISVKEKMRAILKQNGKFLCPNQPAKAQSTLVSALVWPQHGPLPVKPGSTNGDRK